MNANEAKFIGRAQDDGENATDNERDARTVIPITWIITLENGPAPKPQRDVLSD